MAKKAKPGPQGLTNLGTWRLPFSEDVKRRRRQKRELRRPHRLHAGGRPDTVLGTPEMHWAGPPRPDSRVKEVVSYKAKGAGGLPLHEPVFFAPKPRGRKRRLS